MTKTDYLDIRPISPEIHILLQHTLEKRGEQSFIKNEGHVNSRLMVNGTGLSLHLIKRNSRKPKVNFTIEHPSVDPDKCFGKIDKI